MTPDFNPLELTPAQRQAADPRISAWVEASAGTGKTQVLTARVLRLLLLPETKPTRILCLTFTRAAAAEMATRIAERLGLWAILPDDDLQQELEKIGHDKIDESTLARARRLFAQVLDAPGGMRIMTIHAFCQSVLQRFPLEAGLAPHFTVLDEDQARALMHEARDTLLSAEAPEPALGDPLARLAAWVGEDDFNKLMQALASERGRLSRALQASGGIEGLAAAIRKRHGVDAVKSETDLLAAACAEDAFDRGALTLAVQALQQGSKSDKERGQVVADWLVADTPVRTEMFDRYVRAFLTKQEEIRATLATGPVENKYPGTIAALTAEAQRIVALMERRRALAVAEASVAVARLGDAMLTLYARRKREAGVLDYDDLVLHTRRLLEAPGNTGWVLFKLDGGLDHILIDEAQDTNPDQWAIVRALTEEFFAGEGVRGDAARTVFAVGDPKQSIFSFQRADPAAFAAMSRHFAERVRRASADFLPIELTKSFRSAPPVLALVDAVFAAGAARDGVVEEGHALKHEPERMGDAGLAELSPTAVLRAGGEMAPWSPPTMRVDADQPRARLAQRIADTVREWLVTPPELLKSKNRRVRPGDIMVLVRRRDALVEELVRALKRHNVPVAGVDRMVLTEQLAVMDLMALGDALLLPEDDLTLAAVLKSPLLGLTEDQLYRLAHGRDGSLWAALNARAAGDADGPEARALAELGALLARADFVGPYALYAEILGARGGRRKLVARLGFDAGDPIDEFLAAALSFEREHEPSLQGFLKWLRAGAAEIKRELDQSGRDEVRIMTVHGAKGLQAPIVILPDTQQMPRHDNSVLWDKDDTPLWSPRVPMDDAVAALARGGAKTAREREYRRLLYVALTRAEDRIYVTGWRRDRPASEACWYNLVRDGASRIEAMKPEQGVPEGEGWEGERRVLESDQVSQPKSLDEQARVAAAALPDWAGRDPAPEPEPPTPLAPSSPDEEGEQPVLAPVGAEAERRFRRGLLIHRLLQVLPELPADKRRAASGALLGRWARGLNDEQRAQIAEETLRVLESPDLAPLFGPEGRAEAAIIGRVGSRLISGQVDRLVVRPDEVLILDYKTNRPPPRRVEEAPRAYVRQMAAYRAVLRGIYPGRAVRCALVWTDGAYAMTLPDGLLDRADPTRSGSAAAP